MLLWSLDSHAFFSATLSEGVSGLIVVGKLVLPPCCPLTLWTLGGSSIPLLSVSGLPTGNYSEA